MLVIWIQPAMKRVLMYAVIADIHISANFAYETSPSDRLMTEIADGLAHMSGEGVILTETNMKEVSRVFRVIEK